MYSKSNIVNFNSLIRILFQISIWQKPVILEMKGNDELIDILKLMKTVLLIF